MQTYSGFLIHDNLRTYIDRNGKVTPMFITTDFKTIEEIHTRIDKYWDEWQQWQSKHQINYAKALEVLKDGVCGHDENTDAEDFANRVDDYYERELLNDL